MTTDSLAKFLSDIYKNPVSSYEEAEERAKKFADKYTADMKADQERAAEEKRNKVPLGKKIADAIETVMKPIVNYTVGQIPVIGDYLNYDKIKAVTQSLGETLGDAVSGGSLVSNMMELKLQNDRYLNNMKNKHLSQLITKTLSNPKFINYAVNNVPVNTSILDAVKIYTDRPRSHGNDIDKSINILRGFGYHII